MIGLLMRLYRASPLHPKLGRVLARLLHEVTRRLPSPQIRQVGELRWELDLSEVIDASLWFSGSFEPRAEEILRRSARKGMTVIDIGANIGYHTLPLSRMVGPEGRVVAIEPAERARIRLQRNLALNGIQNVTVLPIALGDVDKACDEVAIQSSYPLSGVPAVERFEVRVARLDSVLEELRIDGVDIIKLDVDGLEAKVLRGAENTVSRCRPIVFFEFTPDVVRANGDPPIPFLDGLLANGYVARTEGGQDVDDAASLLSSLAAGGAVNLLLVPRG